jgi:hypothetical protein
MAVITGEAEVEEEEEEDAREREACSLARMSAEAAEALLAVLEEGARGSAALRVVHCVRVAAGA